MQTLMGVKEDFEFNVQVKVELLQSLVDRGYVLMFIHLHQDPGSAVLERAEETKAWTSFLEAEVAGVWRCYRGKRRKSRKNY